MHEDMLSTPATGFFGAQTSYEEAATKVTDANTLASDAVTAIDSPFRVARSVLAGRFPGLVLPGTLKEQPTDTERKLALQTLLESTSRIAGRCGRTRSSRDRSAYKRRPRS